MIPQASEINIACSRKWLARTSDILLRISETTSEVSPVRRPFCRARLRRTANVLARSCCGAAMLARPRSPSAPPAWDGRHDDVDPVLNLLDNMAAAANTHGYSSVWNLERGEKRQALFRSSRDLEEEPLGCGLKIPRRGRNGLSGGDRGFQDGGSGLEVSVHNLL